MRPIDSIWFNNRTGTCGFVVGEDEHTGERHLYGGVVNGGDLKADEIEVTTWGSKVNITKIITLLSKLKEGK